MAAAGLAEMRLVATELFPSDRVPRHERSDTSASAELEPHSEARRLQALVQGFRPLPIS